MNVSCSQSATTLILGIGILALPAGAARVNLNELTVMPAGNPEHVELYNAGPGSVDVGGWQIRGTLATYTIPSPQVMMEGDYLDLNVGDIHYERGGVTTLIDDLRTRAGRDSVHFGQAGSAPLPPAGMSLARAPDASAGPPPPPSPVTDGLYWTIDPSPTLGGLNDAPNPCMGGLILINELDPRPASGGDFLELYNPTDDPVEIWDWYLINGAAVMPLGGSIVPHGFLVIETEVGFDLEEFGLVYLFRWDGVRLDQIGFHDAPPLGDEECYGRCPDGALPDGPYLGYDYLSSGGDDAFRLLICSLGESNDAACGLTPVELRTWGEMKRRFR